MKQSSDVTGDQGVGMMSRLLYRPQREEGKIFHVGLSGAFGPHATTKKLHLTTVLIYSKPLSQHVLPK